MGNDVRIASEFADLFKNAAIEVKVITENAVIEEKTAFQSLWMLFQV